MKNVPETSNTGANFVIKSYNTFMQVHIKNKEEIEIMKEGGKILTEIMEFLWQMAVPGITTWKMNEKTEEIMKKYGAEASFKTVNHYRYAICACPDEVVVHGLPNKAPLKEGQLLGIDCGVLYKGLHTDASWTKKIQNSKLKIQNDKFLEVGKKALQKAIEVSIAGNRVWDIAYVIQQTIEGAGYNVVPELTGHAIGRKLHEKPDVPGIIAKPRERTEELLTGMALAIEVIYTKGDNKIVYKNNDGWTIATRDKSLAGLFEETIIVTENKPIRITPIVLQ